MAAAEDIKPSHHLILFLTTTLLSFLFMPDLTPPHEPPTLPSITTVSTAPTSRSSQATTPLSPPRMATTSAPPLPAHAKAVDPAHTPDIFHLILSLLDVSTLAAAEQVSRTWFAAIRGNGALWRQACIASGIGADNVEEMDAVAVATRSKGLGFVVREKEEENGRNHHKPKQTLWRQLCADRYPGVRSWHAARPQSTNSHTGGTAFAELPMLGAVVVLQKEGAVLCDAELNPFPASLSPSSLSSSRSPSPGSSSPASSSTLPAAFETHYTHIASAGPWFAGARSASHLGSVAPIAPPTCLEIWRSVPQVAGSGHRAQIPAPHGVLAHVASLHLPAVWAYDLRMYHCARGTFVALLTASARCVDSSPRAEDAHWVSGRGSRSVHLWWFDDVPEGYRYQHRRIRVAEAGAVRSLCVTGEYLILPDKENLHIYPLRGGGYARVPLTPLGAGLASVLSLVHRPARAEGGNAQCTPYNLPLAPPSQGSGAWHDAHALANFGVGQFEANVAATREHLVYTTQRGAVAIVHNFRTRFRTLFADMTHPNDRTGLFASEIVSAGTLLIASFPVISRVEVCGDRIAVLMRSSGRTLTLDGASIPAPPTRQKFTAFPDLWAATWQAETALNKYEAFRSPLPVTRTAEGDEGPQIRLALHHSRFLFDMHPGALTTHTLLLSYRDSLRFRWRGEKRNKTKTMIVRWGGGRSEAADNIAVVARELEHGWRHTLGGTGTGWRHCRVTA